MSRTEYGVVPADQVDHWADEADVVIVGLGCAGVCAAIEAREAGADVVVLERASGGGGVTAMAAGHVYLGGGTRVQKAVGVEDSVEDMFRYLVMNTPEPDEAKIRLYCEQSVAHFDWLVAHGVPFNDTMYQGKHVLQMTDECLIWSGNEEVHPFRDEARPAPRGHKVAQEGHLGGAKMMECLIQRAEALGRAHRVRRVRDPAAARRRAHRRRPLSLFRRGSRGRARAQGRDPGRGAVHRERRAAPGVLSRAPPRGLHPAVHALRRRRWPSARAQRGRRPQAHGRRTGDGRLLPARESHQGHPGERAGASVMSPRTPTTRARVSLRRVSPVARDGSSSTTRPTPAIRRTTAPIPWSTPSRRSRRWSARWACRRDRSRRR